MSQLKIRTNCDYCGKELDVYTDIPDAPVTEITNSQFPIVRSHIKPIGNIMVYRISSEQIKDFIINKARKYVPDVRMTIVPRYCEKKRKSNNDPHRSYASLRIAFSDNVIEKKEDLGWYGNIGDNGSNVKMHPSIMKKLIDKYKYDRKQVEAWMKNYKTLEELEDTLGMTEAYINDLYTYTIPQRVKADNNENWIIFAAAAENVIADMLSEKTADDDDPNKHEINKPIGRIQIQDVYPISKDIVEFVVYVHPAKMKLRENPHVRQILLGEEKPKKK